MHMYMHMKTHANQNRRGARAKKACERIRVPFLYGTVVSLRVLSGVRESGRRVDRRAGAVQCVCDPFYNLQPQQRVTQHTRTIGMNDGLPIGGSSHTPDGAELSQPSVAATEIFQSSAAACRAGAHGSSPPSGNESYEPLRTADFGGFGPRNEQDAAQGFRPEVTDAAVTSGVPQQRTPLQGSRRSSGARVQDALMAAAPPRQSSTATRSSGGPGSNTQAASAAPVCGQMPQPTSLDSRFPRAAETSMALVAQPFQGTPATSCDHGRQTGLRGDRVTPAQGSYGMHGSGQPQHRPLLYVTDDSPTTDGRLARYAGNMAGYARLDPDDNSARDSTQGQSAPGFWQSFCSGCCSCCPPAAADPDEEELTQPPVPPAPVCLNGRWVIPEACQPHALHSNPGAVQEPSCGTCSQPQVQTQASLSGLTAAMHVIGDAMRDQQRERAAEAVRAQQPKAFRPVANPGHRFPWALENLNGCASLEGYTTSLTSAEVGEACPRVQAGIETALTEVSPTSLLKPLFDTTKRSDGEVSPMDYARSHRHLLMRLIAAVAAIPDLPHASAQASRYLFDAIKGQQDKDSRIRNAWASLSSSSHPATPTPLLEALASSFLPPEIFGSRYTAYHEYLSTHFDMSTDASIPSRVLAMAIQVTKEQHPLVSDLARDLKVKELYADWVKRLLLTDPTRVQPLYEMLLDLYSRKVDATQWMSEFRMHEQPHGRLHSLVQSLTPRASELSRERHVRRRGLGEQLNQVQPHTSINAFALTDHADGSGVPPVAGQPPPLVASFAAQSKERDPNCAALLPEHAAAVKDPRSPFFLEALTIWTGKMDGAWVSLYGCSDLGPPPNSPSIDRPRLPLVELAKALDIAMPEAFFTKGQGRPHVGGDTCFACLFLAYLRGVVPCWHIHPADSAAAPGAKPKPFGSQHMYLHQVFKCGTAYALAHRLVRCDRESGRGDINKHVFDPWTA